MFVVAALCVVGLVMVMSASSVDALRRYGSSWHYFIRQSIAVVAGAGALWAAARVDYHRWRRFAPPLVVVAAALLLFALIPGVGQTAYGASRWIGAGPLQFQPSELAKLALILFGADVLARHPPQRDGPAAMWVFLGATAIVALLVMKEPDMGTTMVIVAIAAAVLLLAGIPWSMFLGGFSAVVALGTAVALYEPYRRARLLSFADPFKSATVGGYQVVQSLVGLGSGGLTGVGLGASRSKWGFLPNAHTDFIFAVLGEELGLIGALLVLGLFAALAVYGFRATRRAPDLFGALVAGGVTMWLVGQAALNMATVVGGLPVTGVPLPFVSHGGTSTLIAMAAAGVVINIARQGRASASRP